MLTFWINISLNKISLAQSWPIQMISSNLLQIKPITVTSTCETPYATQLTAVSYHFVSKSLEATTLSPLMPPAQIINQLNHRKYPNIALLSDPLNTMSEIPKTSFLIISLQLGSLPRGSILIFYFITRRQN